jgi:hypothetical protein
VSPNIDRNPHSADAIRGVIISEQLIWFPLEAFSHTGRRLSSPAMFV